VLVVAAVLPWALLVPLVLPADVPPDPPVSPLESSPHPTASAIDTVTIPTRQLPRVKGFRMLFMVFPCDCVAPLR
jgi:hypothetical protein